MRRTIVLRDTYEKQHPEITWQRPDQEFFAAGACHILAGVFLSRPKAAGFDPFAIVPGNAGRGYHIFCSRRNVAFDAYGFQPGERLVHEYSERLGEIFPSWTYTIQPITLDLLSDEFCLSTGHRLPSQFPGDVIERAERYVDLLVGIEPRDDTT